MTVSSEVNRAGPYLGNGSTTVFGFGFRILDASHLRVIITSATGAESDLPFPAGYSVSGVGASAGGAITVDPAPVTGSKLTILRRVPIVQETDLENQGAYYAETVERSLDFLTMQNQQQAEELQRSVKVPAGDPDPDGELSSGLALGILRIYRSADNVDLVANSIGRVDLVAGSIEDVGAVARDIEAVVSVSGELPAVRAVSDNMAGVLAVFANEGNVNVVADNIDLIEAASGSILDLEPVSLTGDGTTVSFDLGAVLPAENVLLWVNSVRQVPDVDYTMAAGVLTFAAAPGAGAEIEGLLVRAASLGAVQALYDDFLNGTTIRKHNIITTAAQRRYSVDAVGAVLYLKAATSAVFGSSPMGMLTLGVDYTIDGGDILFSFDPMDGELFHIISMPRVSNSVAQGILDDFEDRVLADVTAAEAALAEAQALLPNVATQSDLVAERSISDDVYSPRVQPRSSSVPIATDGRTLYKTKRQMAKLKAGLSGARVRWTTVGDSWSSLLPIAAGLVNLAGAKIGTAAGTFAAASTETVGFWPGNTLAVSAGWTWQDASSTSSFPYGVGIDGHVYHTTGAAETITLTGIRGINLMIYTRQWGGTWRYRVDGGSWVTVVDGSGGGLRSTSITGLTDIRTRWRSTRRGTRDGLFFSASETRPCRRSTSIRWATAV